jgi:hypothetical protein
MLRGAVVSELKKCLAGLVLAGGLSLMGGCEVNIEGLDELEDYVIDIYTGCDYCDGGWYYDDDYDDYDVDIEIDD